MKNKAGHGGAVGQEGATEVRYFIEGGQDWLLDIWGRPKGSEGWVTWVCGRNFPSQARASVEAQTAADLLAKARMLVWLDQREADG